MAPSDLSIGRLNDLSLAVRYTLSPPHFLVVLGMHRSGTSCISRALNLAGVAMGPLDDNHRDGEELHWEPSSLVWVNDEILRRTGGTWSTLPATIDATNRDVWRCRRFLWNFGGSRLASFKDPRTCITYPVWKSVLPAHSIVVCIRHPLNVAQSLARREGWPLERGLELWRDYNLHLIEHIKHARSLYWFDFDRGRDALAALVGQVAHDFQLPAPAEEVLNSYEEGARHHRDEGELPGDVAAVYASLQARCALPA